ncbi:MAG: hypothetical protein QXJ17_01025 [Nitrososphaeria archaeon]
MSSNEHDVIITTSKFTKQAQEEGKFIGIRDVIAGAIALAKGYTLVTRNIIHLEKIKVLARHSLLN